MEDVKRPYRSDARRARSADTRRRVLDAARELFATRGYRATTVAAIADAAGVHLDTVYALVGRKPALLRELIEQSISGTDRAVVAEERPHVHAIRAASDPHEKLAIYARALRETHARMAPLFLAVRDAGATEPAAAAVWKEIAERRASNMRRFVADLAATTPLRAGLSVDEAADIVWVTNSPEVYALFVDERGWSGERYEAWLVDTWQRVLLP